MPIGALCREMATSLDRNAANGICCGGMAVAAHGIVRAGNKNEKARRGDVRPK